MEYPNLGQNVTVTLADGTTCEAYWDGTTWMVGVDNDPLDAPLGKEVISWVY